MTTCNHPLAPGSLLRCVRDEHDGRGHQYEAAWKADEHDASEAKSQEVQD